VRIAAALAALWLCAGCFGGGATTETETDPQIVRFAQRIDRFYRQLENLPVDVRLTFEDTSLRAYFSDAQQFSAYYASLADQIRRAQFRNSIAQRVDITGFRFEADDKAVVVRGRRQGRGGPEARRSPRAHAARGRARDHAHRHLAPPRRPLDGQPRKTLGPRPPRRGLRASLDFSFWARFCPCRASTSACRLQRMRNAAGIWLASSGGIQRQVEA
jgi:hypothetical protein